MSVVSTTIRRFTSLVFFDLETTDLPRPNRPHRVTELSLCAVERSHFINAKNNEIPRVTNRLNLCLNPTTPINPMAARISQLDNVALQEQSPFDNHAFNIVHSFLCRLKPPVCLIAHNGFNFDFPLLKAEIERIGMVLGEDVLCADSLQMFRKMYPNEKNDLSSVYQRFHQQKPSVSHAAEADVITLLLSTMSVPNEFLSFVELNAIPFQDIKKSW